MQEAQNPDWIVGVAIKWKGEEYRLPKPNRHHDVIYHIHEKTGDLNIYGKQGFYTQDGRYLNREDAGKLALETGQIENLRYAHAPRLYSEDLW